ncbi:unnamed protein product, partial [Laminaria digitata]
IIVAIINIYLVYFLCVYGFFTGIPTTMAGDIAPSLKALDNAVMENPKV